MDDREFFIYVFRFLGSGTLFIGLGSKLCAKVAEIITLEFAAQCAKLINNYFGRLNNRRRRLVYP